MRLEEIRSRLVEIRSELEANATIEERSDEDDERFDSLTAEVRELTAERDEINTRNAELNALSEALESDDVEVRAEAPLPPVVKSKADPFDGWEGASRSEQRGRAIDAIERAVGVDDEARAEAIRKLEGASDVRDEEGKLPKLILATSSDEYRKAWVKLMAGRDNSLTAEERNAVARAEETRAALQLTQSGYAVPAIIDPTVILTTDGVNDPMRQVSRVESITANQWKPITSGGITASWDGEIAEVSDDTPTLAQPTITAHKAQAFAQGSIEHVEDWAAVAAELAREFADAKANLEAAAFVSGTGSGQPVGLATALDGTASEIGPATTETFAAADVYSTIEAVPPRHRGSQTTVMAELSTINAVRQFGTTDPNFTVNLQAGAPQALLGYRLLENSSMDAYSALNPGATADNFLILAGDFRNYVIVDRIGLSVEFIPHLFNTANNLPDGRRGWYCHWRVGADSVNDNAFAMLSIPTTL